MRTTIAVLGLALLGFSCASTRLQEVYVSAIDTNEKEIVCAVMLENEPLLNEKNEPVKTPGWVKIPFKGDLGVKLGVRSVELGPDGKIIRGLQEGDAQAYIEDWRVVLPSDVKRQLFILRKNKASGS